MWHFASKNSGLKVEKVNKRALRVVLTDYVSSYPELLLKIGRSSLCVSRIKTIATEMYKCKNDINPAFVGELFTSHDPPYSLRNGEKFEQPIVNTKSFGLNAFRYEGAKIWNVLPNEFKGKIRKWSGPSCRCVPRSRSHNFACSCLNACLVFIFIAHFMINVSSFSSHCTFSFLSYLVHRTSRLIARAANVHFY